MMNKKGKESVWDYPRPPRVESYPGLVEIRHYGHNLESPFKGGPGTWGW